jgi:hypothetical protein
MFGGRMAEFLNQRVTVSCLEVAPNARSDGTSGWTSTFHFRGIEGSFALMGQLERALMRGLWTCSPRRRKEGRRIQHGAAYDGDGG